MGMNQHEKPAPPTRRWGEALDPHAHQGPYRPPAALLDILCLLYTSDAADDTR